MESNDFYEKVYSALKKVPVGKVVTYKSLGGMVGTKAYRAVGTAMAKNPQSFPVGGDVPCHRVVKSDGKVGQFGFGADEKIKLLKSEGVEVKNGKIDLGKFGYNGK